PAADGFGHVNRDLPGALRPLEHEPGVDALELEPRQMPAGGELGDEATDVWRSYVSEVTSSARSPSHRAEVSRECALGATGLSQAPFSGMIARCSPESCSAAVSSSSSAQAPVAWGRCIAAATRRPERPWPSSCSTTMTTGAPVATSRPRYTV